MNNAINDTTLDLNATIAIFENVKERIKNECTLEEVSVLLVAIEIGASSLSYWNTNFDNWVALASENKATAVCDSCNFNWKQVGKNDVAGGIGGAVATGVVGATGGPFGWGVFGAGTLGGAVAASVQDIILQWWD